MLTAFLFSPIGRIVAGIVLGLVLVGGIYLKVRHDAVAEIRLISVEQELKRTDNAIRSGDTLKLDGDRLRDTDRNARD